MHRVRFVAQVEDSDSRLWPNKSMNKKPLVIVVVVLLLCGVAAWLVLKSRHGKAPNMPPIAALRVDSIDEAKRVVTVSDGGSRDSDGTVQSWRLAWGDGKEENFSSIPQKTSHTYESEGQYQISLWCVDNLGATSSPPALANVTLAFEKRQALAQAEAKEAEAKRLEQARKDAERLEQEKAMAAEETRKAKEQQEQEAKRKAEAELARQKAIETQAAIPPPDPLAKELPDKTSSTQVIFTPNGYTLGEFRILKEKIEGKAPNGNTLVILAIRCVNFPVTPIVTSNWRIDGKELEIPGGRIRANLPPGQHDVVVYPKGKGSLLPAELKADVTVEPNGDCIVTPKK